MKINPNHIEEFRNWMRAEWVATAPNAAEAAANLAEVRGIIAMMKNAQWPILADVADRAESDVVGTVEFDQDDLLELDDYELPFYEAFLRSRPTKR
jgi:hypothetical protein